MSFMHDTDLATQRKYYEMLRALSPEKRLEQGLRLSQFVREMCLDSIRRQYPEYNREQVVKEYLKRILKPDEFRVFYPKGLEA